MTSKTKEEREEERTCVTLNSSQWTLVPSTIYRKARLLLEILLFMKSFLEVILNSMPGQEIKQNNKDDNNEFYNFTLYRLLLKF
jgi:hypothetical protein